MVGDVIILNCNKINQNKREQASVITLLLLCHNEGA